MQLNPWQYHITNEIQYLITVTKEKNDQVFVKVLIYPGHGIAGSSWSNSTGLIP